MRRNTAEPRLQIRLLGPPQIRWTDRDLHFARHKVQALLYTLAVNRAFQARATLATLLWPESDQQFALGSLRRHLSELNRLLGPGWLETQQDAVRLARRPELWVDVAEFQRLVASGPLGYFMAQRCNTWRTSAAWLAVCPWNLFWPHREWSTSRPPQLPRS